MKIEEKIKIFHDKNKWKGLMPTKIDPQKTLEEILHSEENDKHTQRDTENK